VSVLIRGAGDGIVVEVPEVVSPADRVIEDVMKERRRLSHALKVSCGSQRPGWLCTTAVGHPAW
jgi:hypothetical protein